MGKSRLEHISKEPNKPLNNGEVHARTRILSEPAARYRRAAASIGLAGLVVLFTGCGIQGPGGTPEDSHSPSASISPAAPAGPSITGGEVIKTDKGEYLQSTIADDDPAMTYDPATAIGNPEDHVSREQIEKGQKFTVKFLAEEVMDSPLNNNASGVDGWWSKNKDKFDPVYQDSIRKDFDDGDGPAVRNKWQEDYEPYDYEYIYSPTETRLSDRNIDVYEVYFSENNLLVIKTNWDYTAKVQTPDGIALEKVTGDYTVGLTPSDKEESGWVISHYSHTYDVVDFIEPNE